MFNGWEMEEEKWVVFKENCVEFWEFIGILIELKDIKELFFLKVMFDMLSFVNVIFNYMKEGFMVGVNKLKEFIKVGDIF